MGKTEAGQDGSFLVYVSLKQLWPPPTKPEIWEVAARVVMEEGHPVIDDINYIYGGDEKDYDSSLSKSLIVVGCEGPRWVGHGEQRGISPRPSSSVKSH